MKTVWVPIFSLVGLLLVVAISGCAADGFEAGVEALDHKADNYLQQGHLIPAVDS